MHLSRRRSILAVFILVSLFGTLFPPVADLRPATAQESSDPEASSSNQRPEIKSLRTKYSKTYREPDASLTAEIANAPIHFRNGDGWDEIDNTLVPCGDTSCAWRNKAGGFAVDFPNEVNETSQVSIQRGGRSFGFGIVGGRGPGAPPLVDGNSITYTDVLPTVDLRYEVLSTQVKELIVLNQPPPRPVSITFPLKLTGLSARQLSSGEIELVDDTGEVVFTIPLLWMEDSADSSQGAPNRSDAVAMTLENRGSSQFIHVAPDHAWLTAPERVYPVKVDPATVIGDNEGVPDTYVQSGAGSNGSLDHLRLEGGLNPARALIKFPYLSSVPSGAVVRASELRAFNYDGNSCSNWWINVHKALAYWDEATNWSNQPGAGAFLNGAHNVQSKRASGTYTCAPDFLEFPEIEDQMPTGCLNNGSEPTPSEMTSVVRGWVAGNTNNGFILKAADESNTRHKLLRSKESTRPPTLVVNYTMPPTAPDLLSINTSSSQTQPTLSARYNDPDTDVPDYGCVRFEVRAQDGSESLRWGYGPANGGLVAPGETATWTVTPALTRGKTYIWKARGFDEWKHGAWSGDQTYTVPPPPPPPAPSISGPNPSGPSNYLSPNWTFSGQSGGYFQCQLLYEGVVKDPWKSCDSRTSHTYYLGQAGYYDGNYRIQVRQVDDFGGVGSVGWGNTYRLDRASPPQPNITSSPASPDRNTNPQWGFESGGGDTASFLCQLVRSNNTVVHSWNACTTPKPFNVGEHGTVYHFEVKARDAAGNESSPRRSAGYELDIKADPPSVTGPTSPSADANPSWSFTGESGATFQCRLSKDGAEVFAPDGCSSPQPYNLTGKDGGIYRFHVLQVDRVGNTSGEATSDYIYDAAPPTAPTVTASPHSQEAEWYSSRTPTFSWTMQNAPPSGISGYSYLLDRTEGTIPPDEVTGTAATKSYDNPPLDEGIWHFHVKARSGSGVWGTGVGHRRIQIDATAPSKPVPASKSHVPGVAFQNNRVEVSWTASSDTNPGVDDVAGVKEYLWAFRPEGPNGEKGLPADGVCADPADCRGDVLAARSSSLADGRYWFHVSAVDRAGNKADAKPYGPLIVAQDGATVPLAPTLTDALVPHSDTNGLEQFYPYRSVSLGTADAFVNLYSGSLVVQQQDTVIPGVGLNTVIRHTYNSQRDASDYHDNGMGNGWVLSLSDATTGLDAAGGLTGIDLNTPLLATAADVVAGAAGQILELTDADGTTHRFVKDGLTGSRWIAPPGVNLRVQETVDGTTGLPTRYDLIRPDGVRYVVERVTYMDIPAEWRVVAVADRSGNELALTYGQYAPSASRLFKTRLETITHNRYPNELVARFNYHANGNLDTIETLPTVARREIDFTIEPETQRLVSVTENSHTDVRLGRRTTLFGYEKLDPDNEPLTDNSVDLLTSVTDARNNPTAFAYKRADGAYRIASVGDRRNKLWAYGFRTDATSGDRITDVTSPLGLVTTYRSSQRDNISNDDNRIAGGNIREIVDAGNNAGAVVKKYDWVENRLVSRSDAAGATTMKYNDLGLLESITSPPPNDPGAGHLHPDAPTQPVTTSFDYEYPGEYPQGEAASCNEQTPAQPTGPHINHQEGYCEAVADLTREVAADNVDAAERAIDFVYDADGSGDLVEIIERVNRQVDPATSDPEEAVNDRVTKLAYYSSGLLRSVNGPRAVSDVTLFGSQDLSDPYGGYNRTALPRVIEDGAGNEKTFEYNPYGAVVWMKDREGRVQELDYDERDNLKTRTDLWQSLSSSADDRVTSFTYDENDNLATTTPPRDAETPSILGDFTTTFVYNENDQRAEVRRPGAVDHTDRRVTTFAYNDDGLRISIDGPLAGIADRTNLTYWPNGALRAESAPGASGTPAVTGYFYDLAGRVARVQLPKVAPTGGAPEQIISYTPQGAPSVVRATSWTGDIDRITKGSYDAHGRLIEMLGPRKADGVDQAQQQRYDSFGQLEQLRTRLDANKWLEYGYSYDPAGNVGTVSQPAGDGGKLVTKYRYDALNRLAAQTLDPFNPGHTVEYSYLAEGQQQTRVDYVDPDLDGPLTKDMKREITHTYNPDGSVQKLIASDDDGKLAQCNYEAGVVDPTSGYDRDGNLLTTRTVKGPGGCDSGDEVAKATYTYNQAGWMSGATQVVDPVGAPGAVTRNEEFTYRKDGAVSAHVYDGRTTRYEHSGAGWMEAATDWRGGPASTFSYSSAGSLEEVRLGGDVAKGVSGYHPDGSLRSLIWTNSAGAELRAHRSLTYDVGGLWTGETVSIMPAAGDTKVDTGGTATFGHDLAGRLTSWKSPFRLDPDLPGTDGALTNYTLDDGGNITNEIAWVDGKRKREISAVYRRGRLESRKIETFGLDVVGEKTVTDQSFDYNGLGEEEARYSTTRVVDDPLNRTATADTSTSFDPRGFTSSFQETETASDGTTKNKDLDYVYDASGRVISRTRGNGATRLYFYFGGSRQLIEETIETGASRVRYFVGSSGQALAEQRVGGVDGDRWVWLLRDAKGSVATELRDNGVVIGQRAYDPYGAPDAGGSSKTQGEDHSTLGFQAAHTDDVSGRILLGERQYDPTTERFTTPDVYIGSGADLSLGTDPLTGNRYIFAAANPTAFYDDGHGPLCGEDQQICKSHTTKKAVNRRNQQARDNAPAPAPSSFQATDHRFSNIARPLGVIGDLGRVQAVSIAVVDGLLVGAPATEEDWVPYYGNYSDWWRLIFTRGGKHFVERDLKPSFKWNHGTRIEYDGRPTQHERWHSHKDHGPARPLGGPFGALGGEVMILPPLPPSLICFDYFGTGGMCSGGGGFPPS